ncbi:uncharacterized protein CDV56_102947 [Aspergillus thermomutatus]|uniref:Uncharacterized protein n=1 Tax=Aspergillus thermomutatus TaxID=41047 RepID=A0A397H0Q1_ASPTH|nr:uncharacterized protein CDV56_102947 [Aspergillus thermomutatus]RHZ56259.1 hypothetical protein CDV56_102947 [Aspergillus thermomutatus]
MLVTLLRTIRTAMVAATTVTAAMVAASMVTAVVVFVVTQGDCKCLFRRDGSGQRDESKNGEQLDEVHLAGGEEVIETVAEVEWVLDYLLWLWWSR